MSMRVGLVSRCFLVGAAALAGCVSTDSPILDSTEECKEFRPGETIDTSTGIDPTVLRFMQASADFSKASEDLKGEVLTACAAIATDLGGTDTWSSIQDVDKAVSNDDGTGACDVATRLVEEKLIEGGSAKAKIALKVSSGVCRFDWTGQVACDAECAVNGVCDSGSAETRCDPASLSVMCDTSCAAGATCEGRPDIVANCAGSCEATCQGQCTGSCFHDDGTITENDPNCNGKCTATCNGSCSGHCEIEAPAGVQCGVNVRCTGGCTGTFSDPACTTEFKPPTCQVDTHCLASCEAELAATAMCDPPIVKIVVDLKVAPALEPVVRTLEKNLPPLIAAAQEKGLTLQLSARELASTGESIKAKLDNLNGHSLSCLAASSTALAEALGHFDVSVRSGVKVTTVIRTHME